jgi:hypothetical protein
MRILLYASRFAMGRQVVGTAWSFRPFEGFWTHLSSGSGGAPRSMRLDHARALGVEVPDTSQFVEVDGVTMLAWSEPDGRQESAPAYRVAEMAIARVRSFTLLGVVDTGPGTPPPPEPSQATEASGPGIGGTLRRLLESEDDLGDRFTGLGPAR